MSAEAIAMTVPRVVLKPVFQSFRGKSEHAVANQLRMLGEVDPRLGLEAYALTQQATDFEDFYARMHAAGQHCLDAAAKIGEFLSASLFQWDEDTEPGQNE